MNKNGYSLIELILAIAIFAILASVAVTTILHSFTVGKLSEEEGLAQFYAQEGIEAVRSIKNRSYSNLVAGTYGLSSSGSQWNFSGSSDSSSKYTRQIVIDNVNRDGSGNIVTAGGTLDPDTKKVTSTVNWDFSESRTANSTTFETYLTNFRKSIQTLGDGILIYLDNSSTSTDDQPEYRSYSDSSNNFGNETNITNTYTDTQDAKTFKLKTSPTKVEAIAGYVDNGGTLRVLCFDGSTWSSEWTQTVGGTGTNDQRFGIAFEKTSGDALIVYSTNTANSNEMAYRTKSGSLACGSANWSSATNITAARTNGIVHWIRMEASPAGSTNNIAVVWADDASDLSAMIWTGSSFSIAEPASALETNLERVSVSQDVQSFDVAYENTTGNLMIVWGLSQASSCSAGTTIATTNCIRYARYTSSWSSVAVIPTIADPATNVDITANPNTSSNEIALAALDNSQGDLSTAYWSGSAWTGRANVDTSSHCVTAGDKLVATGWLINGAQTRSIYVYHDANNNNCTTATTNIGWYIASGSGAPSAQTDFTPSPTFAAPQRWYDVQMDPNDKTRLMLTVSDNNSDLFAKRLSMNSSGTFISPDGFTNTTNTEGSTALETTLGQAATGPFAFAYWRNP